MCKHRDLQVMLEELLCVTGGGGGLWDAQAAAVLCSLHLSVLPFPDRARLLCVGAFPPALHGAGGAAVPSPYECKHWDERVGACFPHVPAESACGCSFGMQGQSEGSHLGVIPTESSGMAHSVLKGCVPTL